MSIEQITDTLLHELSHIVFGPHNADFNNLWNELRDEHQSLLMKGYTGEAFLTQGKKIGGRRVPLDEMRRQARIAAAEKRKDNIKAGGGGQRLGGAPVVHGVDMRKVIADAASRRGSITDGCASNSSEAGRLVYQQELDGFRTKAEEDDANDMAIAQALQDLMYEEEMARLGAPSGQGGLTWDREKGLSFESNSTSRAVSPAPSASSGLDWSKDKGLSIGAPKPAQPERQSSLPKVNSQGRPLSRLVTEQSSSRPVSTSRISSKASSRLSSQDEEDLRNKALPPIPPLASPQQLTVPTDPDKWACPQCTLHNPLDYLTCEACGLEQPPQPIPQHKRFGPSHAAPTLPKPPPQSGLRGQSATPYEPARGRIGWNCLECGTFMENQWWTCSLCGAMKLES
jgi:hypothetical protein